MRQTAHSGPMVVSDGIVGCWDAAGKRSYPGTGDTWYDVVGGNNGTLENNGTNLDFHADNGGYFTFDGTDDYCLIGKKTQLDWGSGDGSVAAWYRTSSTNTQHIVGNGSSNPGGKRYVLMYGGFVSEALLLNIDDDGSALSADVDRGASEDDQWHYAVGMREGTNIHLYLDGSLVDTTAIGSYGSLDDSTYGFLIAGLYNVSNGSVFYCFDGDIAVVHSYNRALTAAEVKQNYHALKGRFA